MTTHDARINTRVSAQAKQRLELTAIVRRQTESAILDQLLSEHLPSIAELTTQITDRNGGDH